MYFKSKETEDKYKEAKKRSGLTKTRKYKGANKGNGRYYRRKRYEEGKC